MATFFRRLAKAAPIAFGGQTKSASRLGYGAVAAVSAGISSYYLFSSPNLGFSDQLNEDAATPKIGCGLC